MDDRVDRGEMEGKEETCASDQSMSRWPQADLEGSRPVTPSQLRPDQVRPLIDLSCHRSLPYSAHGLRPGDFPDSWKTHMQDPRLYVRRSQNRLKSRRMAPVRGDRIRRTSRFTHALSLTLLLRLNNPLSFLIGLCTITVLCSRWLVWGRVRKVSR
jgi:hypothetical protein